MAEVVFADKDLANESNIGEEFEVLVKKENNEHAGDRAENRLDAIIPSDQGHGETGIDGDTGDIRGESYRQESISNSQRPVPVQLDKTSDSTSGSVRPVSVQLEKTRRSVPETTPSNLITPSSLRPVQLEKSPHHVYADGKSLVDQQREVHIKAELTGASQGVRGTNFDNMTDVNSHDTGKSSIASEMTSFSNFLHRIFDPQKADGNDAASASKAKQQREIDTDEYDGATNGESTILHHDDEDSNVQTPCTKSLGTSHPSSVTRNAPPLTDMENDDVTYPNCTSKSPQDPLKNPRARIVSPTGSSGNVRAQRANCVLPTDRDGTNTPQKRGAQCRVGGGDNQESLVAVRNRNGTMSPKAKSQQLHNIKQEFNSPIKFILYDECPIAPDLDVYPIDPTNDNGPLCESHLVPRGTSLNKTVQAQGNELSDLNAIQFSVDSEVRDAFPDCEQQEQTGNSGGPVPVALVSSISPSGKSNSETCGTKHNNSTADKTRQYVGSITHGASLDNAFSNQSDFTEKTKVNAKDHISAGDTNDIKREPVSTSPHTADPAEDEKKYPCFYCGKRFHRASGRSDHERSHNENLQYKCTICGKGFTRKRSVRIHKVRAHTVKSSQVNDEDLIDAGDPNDADCDNKPVSTSPPPTDPEASPTTTPERKYPCFYCGRRFRSAGRRSEHERSHNKSLQFKCNICTKGFVRKQSVRVHEIQAHTVKPPKYNCQKCKVDFRTKEQKEKHMQQHVEGGKLKCQFCGQCFKSYWSFIDHEQSHSDNKFKCCHCAESFVLQSGLNRHKRKVHGMIITARLKYCCAQCKRRFVTKEKKEEHSWKHACQRRYKCSFCAKILKSKDDLRNHERKHNSKSHFPCSNCSKRFTRKQQLYFHEKLHHTEEFTGKNGSESNWGLDFQCWKCKSVFKSRTEKQQHYDNHTAKATRPCTFCGRHFKYVSHRRAHEKRHYQGKAKSCPCCKSKYATRWHVAVHMNKLFVSQFCKVDEINANEMKGDGKPKPCSVRVPQDTIAENGKLPCSSCQRVFADAFQLRAHQVIQHFQLESCADDKNDAGEKLMVDVTEGSCKDTRKDDEVVVKEESMIEEEVEKDSEMPTHMENDYQGEHDGQDFVDVQIVSICEFCDRSFRSEKGMLNHQKKKHKNSKEPYICPDCPQTFSARAERDTHLKQHLGMRKFQCRFCPKRFKKAHHCREHELLHDYSSQIKCKYCDKGFTSNRYLQKHQSGKRSKKPVMCRVCNKCFALKTCLLHHEKVCGKEDSSTSTNTNSSQSKGLEDVVESEQHQKSKKCGKKSTSKRKHKEVTQGAKDDSFMSAQKRRNKCRKPMSQPGDEVRFVKYLEDMIDVHLRKELGGSGDDTNKCDGGDEANSSEEGAKEGSSKELVCKFCGVMFDTDVVLVKHEFLHTKKQATVCWYCNQTFDTAELKAEHESSHEVQSSLCQTCGTYFRKSQHMEKHDCQNLQNDQIDFPCHVCSVKFATPEFLLQHERSHRGRRPYDCTVCKDKFLSTTTVEFHMQQEHGIISKSGAGAKSRKKGAYYCRYCYMWFSKQSSWEMHERGHVGASSYPCYYCKEMFQNRATLLRHEETHAAERPYQCELCGLRFRNDHKKQNHAIQHRESEFRCEHCPRNFNMEIELYGHEKAHPDMKRYCCQFCDEKFACDLNRMQHARRTHKATYPCPLCGQKLVTSSALARHLIEHKKKNQTASKSHKVAAKNGPSHPDDSESTRGPLDGTVEAPSMLNDDSESDPCMDESTVVSNASLDNANVASKHEPTTVNNNSKEKASVIPKNKSSAMTSASSDNASATSKNKSTAVDKASSDNANVTSKHESTTDNSCSNDNARVSLKHEPTAVNNARSDNTSDTSKQQEDSNCSEYRRKLRVRHPSQGTPSKNKDGKDSPKTPVLNDKGEDHADEEVQEIFQCKFCGKDFQDRDVCIRHEVLHAAGSTGDASKTPSHDVKTDDGGGDEFTGEIQEIFHCKFCKKDFQDRRICIQHEILHSPDKQWKCDICKTSFFTLKLLLDHKASDDHKAHIVRNEAIKKEQKLMAEKVQEQEKLAAEKKEKSAAGKISFELPKLDSVKTVSLPTDSSAYKTNLPNVIDNKQNFFSCIYCQGHFMNMTTFYYHKKTHVSDPKPYRCRYCWAKFESADLRDTHQETHNVEYKHKCSYCERRFKGLWLCKQHEKVHTKMAKLKCEVCDGCFQTEAELWSHDKVHGEGGSHRCSKCGLCFHNMQNWEWHWKFKHPDEVRPLNSEGREWTPPGETQGGNVIAAKTYILHDQKDTNSTKSTPVRKQASRQSKENLKKGAYNSDLVKEPVQQSVKVPKPLNNGPPSGRIVIHYPDTQHKCEVCNVRHKRLSSLYIHERMHTGIKNHKCPKCPSRFFNRGSVNFHMQNEHGAFLERIFSMPQTKDEPTQEQKFQCKICQKLYSNRDHLEEHARLHDPARQFHCEVCPKAFTRPIRLSRHEAVHMAKGEGDSDKYHCSQCDEGFFSKASYSSHVKRHAVVPKKAKKKKKYQAVQPKVYECPHCSKAFGNAEVAKRHEATHFNMLRHICTYKGCEERFAPMTQMERHVLDTHCSDRPYQCSFCPKTFKSVGHFTYHVKSHQPEKKPYICEVCQKGFVRPRAVFRHDKTHSGEKKYGCADCPLRCHSMASMMYHKLTEHGITYKQQGLHMIRDSWKSSCLTKNNLFATEQDKRSQRNHHQFDVVHQKARRIVLGKVNSTDEDGKPSEVSLTNCEIDSIQTGTLATPIKTDDEESMEQEQSPDVEEVNEDNSFICELCTEEFDTERELRRHKRFHSVQIKAMQSLFNHGDGATNKPAPNRKPLVRNTHTAKEVKNSASSGGDIRRGRGRPAGTIKKDGRGRPKGTFRSLKGKFCSLKKSSIQKKNAQSKLIAKHSRRTAFRRGVLRLRTSSQKSRAEASPEDKVAQVLKRLSWDTGVDETHPKVESRFRVRTPLKKDGEKEKQEEEKEKPRKEEKKKDSDEVVILDESEADTDDVVEIPVEISPGRKMNIKNGHIFGKSPKHMKEGKIKIVKSPDGKVKSPKQHKASKFLKLLKLTEKEREDGMAFVSRVIPVLYNGHCRSCIQCGKRFDTDAALTEHRKWHTCSKRIRCLECSMWLDSEKTYRAHWEEHALHRLLYCKHCGKDFPDKELLWRHEKTHNKDGNGNGGTSGTAKQKKMEEKKHACDTCLEAFVTAEELKVHKVSHTAPRAFVCEHCNMSFNQERQLRSHQTRHVGDLATWQKSFGCPLCGGMFRSSDELKSHEKTFHGFEEKFECGFCNRTFGVEKNWRTHESVHRSKKDARKKKR